MANSTLSVTDNRTQKSYEIKIQDDSIRAIDLRTIKLNSDDFGMMSYDPAYLNTASCKSAITYIDGDKGVLRHRGYPIEQLAENSSYLEVAYLLLNGELPSKENLQQFSKQVLSNCALPENFTSFFASFPRTSHPMSMFISAMGALSASYPESKKVDDATIREHHIHQLIAQAVTVGAWACRQTQGLSFVAPRPDLSLAANFLMMLKKKEGEEYIVHPILEKALDVLFILHADHEQNCSTAVMRAVGSSRPDPYASTAAAAAALYGPLHGGANEAVLRMLEEIGHVNQVPAFIADVKSGKAGQRLMGFGHRVYKNYDPRAKIIKTLMEQVFTVTGKNPLLEIAVELERIALQDEYFVSRKLYPNVDFYSGLIYQAMGFPIDLFPVLFAMPRTSGWLSQWVEMLRDPEQKIARPRQIYIGNEVRTYPRY